MIASSKTLVSLLYGTILASSAFVAAVNHADEPYNLHARQHNRMVRKRAPALGFPFPDPNPPNPNPNGDPTTTSASVTPTGVSSTTSSTPSPTSSPSSPAGSSTSTEIPTSVTSILPTITPVANSTTSLTVSSTLSLNSTSSHETTTSTTTSSKAEDTHTSHSTPSTTEQVSTHTVIISATRSTTPTSSPTSISLTTTHAFKIARNTVVTLVAIAGSIGVSFFIWTLIRKWKFKASRTLDDRMGVDWAPDAHGNTGGNAGGHDHMEEKLRRNPSIGSNRSFGSSEPHYPQANLSRSASGRSSMPYGGGAAGIGRPRGDSYEDPTIHPAQHDNVGTHDVYAAAAGHHGPAYSDLTRASPPDMTQSPLARVAAPPSYQDDPYGAYADYDQHGHYAQQPNAPHRGF